MPKVTLLGDSIRQVGYGTRVPAILGKEYEVFQPVDNCRYAQYTLRGLYEWRDDIKGSDIIHWNNGLWDVSNLFDASGDHNPFTPLNVYCDTMCRIADLLLKITPHVIFATITPVNPLNPFTKNEYIDEFNAAIVPLLQKKGIVINDLHTLVYPHIDEYIDKTDLIHLTPTAIEVCATAVANAIRAVKL